MPGEDQSAKVKKVLNRLAQGQPLMSTNPAGQPILVPSIMPEPGVDDPTVCVALSKKWLLHNFDQEATNRGGYMNVLAYLKVSTQMAKEQMAESAIAAGGDQAQK